MRLQSYYSRSPTSGNLPEPIQQRDQYGQNGALNDCVDVCADSRTDLCHDLHHNVCHHISQNCHHPQDYHRERDITLRGNPDSFSDNSLLRGVREIMEGFIFRLGDRGGDVAFPQEKPQLWYLVLVLLFSSFHPL